MIPMDSWSCSPACRRSRRSRPRSCDASGVEHALRRHGVLREPCRGPHGPSNELATTVGAGAVEDVLGAVTAPRAFVGADQDVGGIRSEVAVAAFAAGANLEHGSSMTGRARGAEDPMPIRRHSEQGGWQGSAGRVSGRSAGQLVSVGSRNQLTIRRPDAGVALAPLTRRRARTGRGSRRANHWLATVTLCAMNTAARLEVVTGRGEASDAGDPAPARRAEQAVEQLSVRDVRR